VREYDRITLGLTRPPKSVLIGHDPEVTFAPRRRLRVVATAVLVTLVVSTLVAVTQTRRAQALRATTAVPSANATSSSGFWTATTSKIVVHGVDRSYLVVRPSARGRGALPVIVVLHGRGATPQLERQRTGFPEAVGPAVFVYPAGVDKSWNAGTCCGPAHTAGVDDVAFITAVVRRVLAAKPGADRKRVFLVGFSNGGRMAYRLTCAEPKLFRAFAVVGALPAWPCQHRGQIAFSEVALEHDTIVPLATARSQAQLQATINRCAAVRTSVTVVSNTTWSKCANKSPVELIVYPGATHSWPRGGAAPSAQQLVWEFFRRQ
jgi:polyhydroxybutyrate depolymerase